MIQLENNILTDVSSESTNGFNSVSLFFFIFSEFAKGYDPNIYAFNGPVVFSRTYRQFYGEPKTREEFINKTSWTPFYFNVCFPLIPEEHKHFFEDFPIMEKVKNSFFVHIWNRKNRAVKLLKNETVALITLAKNFCPRVLEASVEYF